MIDRRFVGIAILVAGWALAFGASAEALAAEEGALRVARLRCEGLENPLGIDQTKPRLEWIVESPERNQRQTAYRILVASSEANLKAEQGDLWDSGRVESDATRQIVYGGKPLESRMACYWKAKSWDRSGKESAWSETARWSMGLLKPADWTAQWISYKDDAPLHMDRNKLFLPPARMYRKAFSLKGPVRRATVYASSLGIYDLHLNGQRVDDAFFSPGWSDYQRRAYYNTYDVTDRLKAGENAIGAVVADGWYSGYVGYGVLVGYGPNRVGRYFYGKTPALLAQLEVEYADGRREMIGTDSTWKVTDRSPWREADLIMGEAYDARLADPRWSAPGYAAAKTWANAIRAEENGKLSAPFFDNRGQKKIELGFQRPARMQAYSAPRIRATEELPAVSVRQHAPGVHIFDLGQNFAGIIRLRVQGPAGTTIRLRYGEMLHPDGRLMTENLRRARSTDTYILRGDPQGETWLPRFTYHGFRYVELTGLPTAPPREAVTGIAIHSDTPLASRFESSDPMVNRLFKNVVWTQRANFVEIPTDCPQRDERLGWMGDAQIYVRTATFNADVAAFFTKWLDDLEEAQLPNGAYPDYAPYPMGHGEPGQNFGTAWMDAGIIVPWTIWTVYGDTRLIDRQWASMSRFMQFRRSMSRNDLGVKMGNPWGDWLNLNEPTPVEYVDTCYYAYTAQLMSQMAAATGRAAEASEYSDLFGRIKAAYAKQYLTAEGALKVQTQTAHVLALAFGLLPQERMGPAADRLAEMIEKNGYRMATGFLGTKPLLPVLSANGHHDLAVRLFQSRKFPSWGYEVENGATSIWERWDSYTREHGFEGLSGTNNASMNSFSHYSFGAVCEWMFRSLAGIDTEGVGYQKIVIHPGPPSPGSNPDVAPVSWVKAEYLSPRGMIQSEWKREGNRLVLNVTIPANATATVYMPAGRAADITESGKPLGNEIKATGGENGRVALKVGSGTYQFISTAPDPAPARR